MNNSEDNSQSPRSDDVNSLAHDADRRRDRIEKTLDLLGGKLSPEHLKDQAFDLFREHGSELATGLQRSAKNNPVPLLLTGVGIAWMMMSQRDERQRNEHYRQYPEFRQPPMDTRHIPESRAFSDRDHSDDSSGESLSGKFGAAKDAVTEAASSGWDSMSGTAQEARDATGERLDSMREQSAAMSNRLQQQYRSSAQGVSRTADEWATDASRFMQEQPLVAGALGVALGALLGGLMPTSNKERQLARQAVDSDAGKAAIERSSEMLKSAKSKASGHIEKAGEAVREKIKEAEENTTTTTEA